MTDHPDITPELRARLDAATPTSKDYVMYCSQCGWVGETNAAYAKYAVSDWVYGVHVHQDRIWRGIDPVPSRCDNHHK